jgi:hypothetical protein
MSQEELSDIIKYANFLSLQEKKKDDEEDEADESSNSTASGSVNLLTPSVSSATPTPSGELRIDVKKGGLKVPTTIPKAVGSESTGSMGRAGLVSSITDQQMRTGFANPTGIDVRQVVAQRTLQPRSMMQLAASYEPFNSGQELNENAKMMKSLVKRILSKPEHRSEINKMKTEIRGE